MNSDFLELGLETFNHLTDKYYDHVHDAAGKVGPWLREQRTRSRSRPRNPKENQESMPSSPAEDYPPNRSSRRDRYDDIEQDERRRGERNASRRRDVERDSQDLDSRSSRSSRDMRDSRNPKIRIDTAPGPSRPGSHIYPPAPLPMPPPYPTTAGALVPMPPDGAPYTSLSRSASERGRTRGQQQTLDVIRPGFDRARSTGYYNDEFWDRARDQHGGRRSHSRDGHRHHSQSRKERDLHLGVSLVGAVAGGFLGKKASKGDWKATVAGAVVGALGANVAEREYERHKRKDDKEEDVWEAKWGKRRS